MYSLGRSWAEEGPLNFTLKTASWGLTSGVEIYISIHPNISLLPSNASSHILFFSLLCGVSRLARVGSNVAWKRYHKWPHARIRLRRLRRLRRIKVWTSPIQAPLHIHSIPYPFNIYICSLEKTFFSCGNDSTISSWAIPFISIGGLISRSPLITWDIYW